MSLIVPVPPPNVARLRFVTSPAIFSEVIRWWTDSDFSHCEAVVDQMHGGTIVSAQTAWIDGQQDPGVQNFAIDYDTWSIKQTFFDTLMTPEMYRKFTSALFDMVGKPYNHDAFIGLALHDLNITEKGAYICSQLIFDALRSCGFYKHDLDIPDNGVTPQALYLMVKQDTRWSEYPQPQ